jgi:hypothetical protein
MQTNVYVACQARMRPSHFPSRRHHFAFVKDLIPIDFVESRHVPRLVNFSTFLRGVSLRTRGERRRVNGFTSSRGSSRPLSCTCQTLGCMSLLARPATRSWLARGEGLDHVSLLALERYRSTTSQQFESRHNLHEADEDIPGPFPNSEMMTLSHASSASTVYGYQHLAFYVLSVGSMYLWMLASTQTSARL